MREVVKNGVSDGYGRGGRGGAGVVLVSELIGVVVYL